MQETSCARLCRDTCCVLGASGLLPSSTCVRARFSTARSTPIMGDNEDTGHNRRQIVA